MYKFLDKINSPKDVKKLSIAELNCLSEEIREFLIDKVSQTGGHLASNLGVVELTVAIHKVFDIPEDKMIFDVGHQSYVHKILTGRRDRFDTLRQFNGLSGFPKTNESDCDSFNTGHSSTSISAALGLARARDLDGGKYSVIALFGDGALTGGMMYEAMNDAGRSKTPLILILNDNEMSISKNVGAVSMHLRRLRTTQFYFKSKYRAERFLNKVPLIGTPIGNILRRIKRSLRRMVIPTTLFDEMGINYIGPVDGHSISSLIPCLEYAKHESKPVLIHVQTKKGKGYSYAESNPQKFHGISAFDKETGEIHSSSYSYSAQFGDSLVRIAENNKKVIAITGAMPNGTGLDAFAKKYKNRFFDVGIAEQHGVTFSAGLAKAGYIPVIPLYSSFLQRAYDQVLHDVCLQNLHVVFPIDRAGIVGADGETHQGIYDISFLSHMPNMTILSPSSFSELDSMLEYAICVHKGPIAVRYPRGGTQSNFKNEFIFKKAAKVKDGRDLSIFASGRTVKIAEDVCAILKAAGKDCEIIALPTIKPLDEAAVIASAMKTQAVITIEDNVKIGGIGSLIAELLEEKHVECTFKAFAFPDVPIIHGTVNEIDAHYGMSAESIADEVLKKWVK